MRRPSPVVLLLLGALLVPSPAAAQRDSFFAAVVTFYRSLPGLYGDEGPQLTARLEEMSAALHEWDRQLGDLERDVRGRLPSADVPTRLQIHTTLASLYVERGRLSDAVRQFDEDIRIDPQRAAFHRLKGLVLQAMARHADAADAFRAAWLLDPGEPQHAYRLIACPSPQTTPPDLERARETLAELERQLIRGEHPGAPAPFTNMSGIIDDAGGGMAFVPGAYAAGFAFILKGELERGVAELRAAMAGDPLVTDPTLQSEPMRRGIAALREGAVAAAVEHLQAAVTAASGSSEAHRILGTAYAVAGEIARSVQHLREAVRLNPRDERSRLALAHTLAAAGQSADAEQVLRTAVAELPDASALRWQLSTRSQGAQDEQDRALLDSADRLALLIGKGELYRTLARLAQLHLDDEKAIELLELSVRVAPNNADAHEALGRAYLDNGREVEAYAELVVALLLNPEDVETLTALGRWHLAAGQAAPAVEALERAVALDGSDRFAVHALAGALIRAGRVEEGKARLQESERLQARALEDDRRTKAASVLRLEAAMRTADEDHAGAVDIWREVLLLDPGNAATHLRLAEALASAGRPDEAVAAYLAAIAGNAGADAHRRLAELYESLGRPTEAARERATYVERRLGELRQRAEQGAYGW